jgi:hypothetical protein
MVKYSVYKICILPMALYMSGARNYYGLKSVGIKNRAVGSIILLHACITLLTLYTHTPHANSILQRRTIILLYVQNERKTPKGKDLFIFCSSIHFYHSSNKYPSIVYSVSFLSIPACLRIARNVPFFKSLPP